MEYHKRLYHRKGKGKDQEQEQEQERGNSFLSRVVCRCQPLHTSCNPESCEKAVNRPLSSRVENRGPKERLNIYGSQNEWSNGAKDGCVTCAIVMQLARPTVDQTIRVSRTSEAVTVSCANTTVWVGWKKAQPRSCKAFPLASFPESLSTNSSAAFEFVRTSLRTCMTEHNACRSKHIHEYKLPRRLLDIGWSTSDVNQEAEQIFRPRLIHTSRVQRIQQYKTFEYTALSHCWGQTQIITTTKETLASRLDTVPWKALSKSFQDAVLITHKLGYRYIWIDSLCIIQDDQLDWESESKNMATIYQNSILTIAATKSKNGDGGCFISTPDLPGIDVLHPHTQIPTGLFSRRQIIHWPQHSESQPKVDHWALSKRAWTVQEELLSPRVVYYGPEEVIWQCNTSCKCQCGTIGDHEFDKILYNPDASNGFLDKSLYASFINKDPLSDLISRESLSSLDFLWHKIVVEYSSRQLTKEIDRLPALSGLSKQVQAAGLALVAGVPPAYIHRWLMWRPSGVIAERRPAFIAPSWSWASYPSSHTLIFQGSLSQTIVYETPMWQDGTEFKAIAQFLGITSEAAGMDPNGAVRFSRLSLYTYVASAALGFQGGITPQGAELALERNVYRRSLDYAEDHQTIVLPRYDQQTKLGVTSGKEVLCALISCGATTDGSNNIRTYCLILNAVQDSTYQRVGTLTYDWSEKKLPWDGFELRKITII